MRYAHDRLREINSLRIIGNAKDKGPIVSFEIKGAHPHDVATIIDRSGVAVRAGTHCVMPLLARFGVIGHLPRLLCHVQYARGDRLPCAGAGEGAGVFHMKDDLHMTDEAKADTGNAEPPQPPPIRRNGRPRFRPTKWRA